MKQQYQRRIVIALLVIVLAASVYAAPPTKYDYFNKTGTECGIVSCVTYYRATNPTSNTFTVDGSKLSINQLKRYVGDFSGTTIQYYNGTAWVGFTNSTKFNMTPNQSVKIAFVGNFTPVYNGNEKVSYSVDHVLSFAGYTFPEYDLWNQTWNKCLELNVTYNLGAYTLINETFPVRLRFNSSNTNISAIRADWGDVRYGKGTCGNVTADYTHSLITKNSTDAYVAIYLPAGEIQNNTPAKIVMYYNNTAQVHVEPGRNDIVWGYSVNSFGDARIFTNDLPSDTTSNSYTYFNDTTETTLSTFNAATFIDGLRGKEKQLGANSSLYTSTAYDWSNYASLRGYVTALRFRITNATRPGTYYLYKIGNATNRYNTNIVEAYVVVT